jgi:hypothetical protein
MTEAALPTLEGSQPSTLEALRTRRSVSYQANTSSTFLGEGNMRAVHHDLAFAH